MKRFFRRATVFYRHNPLHPEQGGPWAFLCNHCPQLGTGGYADGADHGVRELEENNIRISCRTFVRHQGVMAGA